MSIGGPAFLEYGETRRRLESSSSFVNVPLLAPSRAKGKEIDYDEWVIRHDAASQSRTGQKRFWWLAGLILLLGALIGAVVVGSFLSVSATRDANFSPDTKVKGDPSSFDKDSRFHKSFAGICCKLLDAAAMSL